MNPFQSPESQPELVRVRPSKRMRIHKKLEDLSQELHDGLLTAMLLFPPLGVVLSVPVLIVALAIMPIAFAVYWSLPADERMEVRP